MAKAKKITLFGLVDEEVFIPINAVSVFGSEDDVVQLYMKHKNV